MNRFLPVLFSIFLLGECAEAHAVDQIYGDFRSNGEHWEIVLTFDIGFAEGDWTDPDVPQKPRAYLEALAPAQHELLRRQTIRAVRESLAVGKGRYSISFPDYRSDPPEFPRLAAGGAYLRVVLTGKIGGVEEVAFAVLEGDRPSFVIKSGEGDSEELRTFWSGDSDSLPLIP